MEDRRPKVGVGVIIVKEGKILLGERLSPHGAGTWSLPGGHVEFGESFEDTARREAAEETGLTDIEIIDVVSLGNCREPEKHTVPIGVLAEWRSGEPKAVEPDTFKSWKWFDPDTLPENIFPPSRLNIDNWRAGKIYRVESDHAGD